MRPILNCKANNVLGSKIAQVRKSKKITQENLGILLGMSKSAISKIESGKKRISAEEAMAIFEVLGEDMVIQIHGYEESPHFREQKTKFLSIGISWFAEKYNLSYSAAYKFLLLYKAVDFMETNFSIEQNLPKAEIVNDLMKICINNGGKL